MRQKLAILILLSLLALAGCGTFGRSGTWLVDDLFAYVIGGFRL